MQASAASGSGLLELKPNVINLNDKEDAWDALDEIEGHVGTKKGDKGKREKRRGASCEYWMIWIRRWRYC